MEYSEINLGVLHQLTMRQCERKGSIKYLSLIENAFGTV
jgi:hypothetical protein